MIQTKEDLRNYLEQDRIANHKPVLKGLKARIVGMLFPDFNYKYVRCLRKLEYSINNGGGIANSIISKSYQD